ncbi:hypothetical protein HK098_007845 [Nowakowskiella sp. JEL0407]|nr:hypothetical protein HK098_007845 [Nowakowskiella sp. JEL0407]
MITIRIFRIILFFAFIAEIYALSVGHKVLIITTEGDGGYDAAKYTLDSYGMPYDTITLTPLGITGPLPLESSPTSGKYSLIVLTTDTLAMQSEWDGWVSRLTPDQFAQIDDYQVRYGVRRVTLNSFPNPAKHYAGLATSEACCASGEQPIIFTDFSPVSAAGILLNASLSSIGLYHYPAVITDPSYAKPVIKFKGGAQNNFPTDTVGGVIITQPTGREEMVFFIGFGWWSPTSLVLGHMWFAWGTRGLYQGSRQIYMNTQIDDIFLDTEAPLLPNQTIQTTYRTTTDDFENLRKWNSDINKRMGPGSDYKIELAFNGNGMIAKISPDTALDIDTEGHVDINFVRVPGDGPDQVNQWPKPMPSDANLGLNFSTKELAKDPLYTYFMNNNKQNQKQYYWLSHTFTHENLNNATAYDTDAEIKTNVKFATNILKMYDEKYFSKKGMVTPQISGVFNADALRTLDQNGITSIVGDTSRPNLISPFGNWFPFITSMASANYDGYTIITRSPTEIYYHCSTEAQNTYIYNTLYEQKLGTNNFSQILQREADRVLFKLLSLHPDGYMFHQANLRKPATAVQVAGVTGQFSLLQQWVEMVVWRLATVVSWPMKSLKQDDMSVVFADRLARKNCNSDVQLIYDAGNTNVTGFTLTAAGSCTIPISVPTDVYRNISGAIYDDTARLPVLVSIPMTPGKVVTVTLKNAIKVK